MTTNFNLLMERILIIRSQVFNLRFVIVTSPSKKLVAFLKLLLKNQMVLLDKEERVKKQNKKVVAQ